MTKRFANYPELTTDLAFDVIEALKAAGIDASLGRSNQSCSAYVKHNVYDADDEFQDEVKVRFSDHDDRHGSDVTFRIDHLITTIEEDDEYIAVEIATEDYDRLVADAIAAVQALRASVLAS